MERNIKVISCATVKTLFYYTSSHIPRVGEHISKNGEEWQVQRVLYKVNLGLDEVVVYV